MKRVIKFVDFESYEVQIRKKLISGAHNQDAEVVFSLHKIHPSLHITKEDIPKFKQWLINKEIVKSIEVIGTDLFRCTLTDIFLYSEILKKGEIQ